MSNARRIIKLNSELKDIIEFRRYDEEEEGGYGRTAAIAGAGAVGGVGLGAGALYARGRMAGAQGLRDSMRAGAEDFRGDYTNARNRAVGGYEAARGYGARAKTYGAGTFADIKGAGRKYGSLRSGANVGLGLGRGAAAKNAAMDLFRKLRTRRFSSNAGRIIELNAALRELMYL